MQKVRTLLRKEKYDLDDQLKGGSRATNANSAERYRRFCFQVNIQHGRLCKVATYETINHFLVASKELYISKERVNKFLRVFNGFINYYQILKRTRTNHLSLITLNR